MTRSFADIERIVERYDTATAELDAAVTGRIADSLDASYRNLERELRRLYPVWQSDGSLYAVQRRLLLMEQLGSVLEVVRPELKAEYEALFAEALTISHESGARMADELVRARDPGYPLQEFTTVPIEAAVAQARDGVQRLYRYNDEFKTAVSGVVEQGLLQGWGADKVARMLRGNEQMQGQFGVAQLKSKAETIARTEIMSAFGTATQQRIAENGLLVQVMNTPSERLCSFCLGRHGNVYEVGQISVPFHPRCRDVLLPYSKKWAERGWTDDAAIAADKTQRLEEMAKLGTKPNYGPTYWEKRAGLTAAPVPVWKPGDAVEKPKPPQPEPAPKPKKEPKPKKPTPTPTPTPEPLPQRPQTYQEAIAKARQEFAPELKTIESAHQDLITRDALNGLNRKIVDLEDDYFKALGTGDQRQAKALMKERNKLSKQLGELELKREATEKAAAEAHAKLREKILTGADPSLAKANVTKVQITAGVPFPRSQYESELTDLYRFTNNQVNTLEAVYYSRERAFAGKPGVVYGDDPGRTDGRINVGRNSNIDGHMRTLWHEYGHHLEFSNPAYAKIAREWIESRATGPLEQLNILVKSSGYEDSERAYPGSFIDPYVAKYYSDGSTEVLSMGLERFVTSSRMVELYAADPEHYLLLLGMLR